MHNGKGGSSYQHTLVTKYMYMYVVLICCVFYLVVFIDILIRYIFTTRVVCTRFKNSYLFLNFFYLCCVSEIIKNGYHHWFYLKWSNCSPDINGLDLIPLESGNACNIPKYLHSLCIYFVYFKIGYSLFMMTLTKDLK